jgi:hypothetical protein
MVLFPRKTRLTNAPQLLDSIFQPFQPNREPQDFFQGQKPFFCTVHQNVNRLASDLQSLGDFRQGKIRKAAHLINISLPLRQKRAVKIIESIYINPPLKARSIIQRHFAVSPPQALPVLSSTQSIIWALFFIVNFFCLTLGAAHIELPLDMTAMKG